jgi:hypothetical protein
VLLKVTNVLAWKDVMLVLQWKTVFLRLKIKQARTSCRLPYSGSKEICQERLGYTSRIKAAKVV